MPQLCKTAFRRSPRFPNPKDFVLWGATALATLSVEVMHLFETERLAFRLLTPADTDDLAALYSDPEVMRYFEGVRTRDQAAAQIETSLRMYDEIGYYFWATIHKEDDRFIGRCGLLPQTIEGNAEVEVAYMLSSKFWHRGLGTEAASGVKEHAFSTHKLSRLISLIDPRNKASIRVAEKNGMHFVKNVRHDGFMDRMYAVERGK
jgi:ribosomal-protein-alanine N-acetyltransferase